MNKKAKITVGVIALILILIFVQHWINKKANYPPIVYYKMNEWVTYENTYRSHPQSEIANGYEIRAVEYQVVKLEDYLQQYKIGPEECEKRKIPMDKGDQIALVTVEIRNESNTDSGVNLDFHLLQGVAANMTPSTPLMSVSNQNISADQSLRFRFPIGESRTFVLAFHLYPKLWEKEDLSHVELIISSFPVSKRIKLIEN